MNIALWIVPRVAGRLLQAQLDQERDIPEPDFRMRPANTGPFLTLL